MRLYKLLPILCFLSIAFAQAPQAAAQSPETTLKQTIDEVLDLLHAGDELSLEEKRSQILELLQSRFSFDIIIRRALGRNWNALDEDQQERITIVISDLLIRAYSQELDTGARPKITFGKSQELGSNKLEIPSKVTYRNTLVSVNYRLANVKNRGWQVYDVLIEGVSMVSNYRKQFDEHFQTKSGAELIAVLEEKLETFDD